MQVSTQPAILRPELRGELRRVLQETQPRFQREVPVARYQVSGARGQDGNDQVPSPNDHSSTNGRVTCPNPRRSARNLCNLRNLWMMSLSEPSASCVQSAVDPARSVRLIGRARSDSNGGGSVSRVLSPACLRADSHRQASRVTVIYLGMRLPARLKRPTRELKWTGPVRFSCWSCTGQGFSIPDVAIQDSALLPHFFTLTASEDAAVWFL
jgi:hypothetical protein